MNFSTIAKTNLTAAGKLTLFAVAMFAFGYALVPLYYKICEVTGINNLLNPQSAEGLSIDKNRIVRLEFDVNSRGLVSMEPNIRLLSEAHPGKTYSVIYTLKNLSGRPLLAQAVPSYGPRRAGRWFRKIQCFCFTQLTMAVDEVRQAPVVFVVESELPTDINVIALSYTFFEIEGGQVPDEHNHGNDDDDHDDEHADHADESNNSVFGFNFDVDSKPNSKFPAESTNPHIVRVSNPASIEPGAPHPKRHTAKAARPTPLL